jgi:hypothetical protein
MRQCPRRALILTESNWRAHLDVEAQHKRPVVRYADMMAVIFGGVAVQPGDRTRISWELG